MERVLNLVESYSAPKERFSLVCHHWERHLAPILWKSFRVWQQATQSTKGILLRRHGVHVRHLVCGTLADKTLRLIAETCPNLTSLMLYARNDSFWASYASLERFFVSLRTAPLTTVHVDFDLSHFDPSFFWSLSQLPRLEELTIRTHITAPYESPNTASILFAGFLECCPTLKVFNFWYRTTMETWYNPACPKGKLERLLKKYLEPSRPTSLPEVQARRIRAPIVQSARREDVKEQIREIVQQSLSPKEYQLRRLDFKPDTLDISTLLQITAKMLYLEELDMRGQWNDIPTTTWTTLSSHCQHLRVLRIHLQGVNTGTPTLPQVVSFFPCLHILELHSQQFRSDPDLSTLGSILKQQEERHGTQHPLESLLIAGSLAQPIRIVVDVLTQGFASLKSLHVEKVRSDKSEQDTDPLNSPQAPPFDLTLPIPCQDTLQQLVISDVTFPDKTSTAKFFTRIQEFSKLATMQVRLQHLRDLISNPPPARAAVPVGGAYGCTKVMNQQSAGERGALQPMFNFSFPTVRVLKLTGVQPVPGHPREGPNLELYETRLFISAFPLLTHLYIQITPDVNPAQFNPARFLSKLIPNVGVVTFLE
ncbi:hypothetical protein BGX24_005007 [Mortierella sp. AD032]|nr:hypothetical protein BGX24_005007 [Mortierella sp. AD032]